MPPAWKFESKLDLKASSLFGCEPALTALLGFIGPSREGDQTQATQSTVASRHANRFRGRCRRDLRYRNWVIRRTAAEAWGLERPARPYLDHPLCGHRPRRDFFRLQTRAIRSYRLILSALVQGLDRDSGRATSGFAGSPIHQSGRWGSSAPGGMSHSIIARMKWDTLCAIPCGVSGAVEMIEAQSRPCRTAAVRRSTVPYPLVIAAVCAWVRSSRAFSE